VIISLILLTPPLMAQTMDEERLDREFKEIAKSLRCAVCQSESVWESNAELARQMRAVIRERLAQGQTPDEIRAYFLSRYGDYILLKPQKSGWNWILWAGPFVLLLAGGILLFRTVSRWVKQTAATESTAVTPIDELTRQRIEQELHSLEK
jgi:cytochrome c-type biogenesis protein CcmH